jgi:NAD(P)-dependent dehydrogenase (short-subunit alcohol dehydrogenase family)
MNQEVILIAGAAGLIGQAITKKLASLSRRIVLLDTNEAALQALAAELSEKNPDLKLLTYSHVDSDYGADFNEITLESWQSNIDLHLNSYFHLSQVVSQHMQKYRCGSIVNFGSIYGLVGPDFTIYEGTKMGNTPVYSAIKGAIANLTRYMAAYLGPWNIRVNAICPGGVFDGQNEIFVKNYVKKVPLRRMANPEDLVGPVLFLISEDSQYITGVNLAVDGGWTAV